MEAALEIGQQERQAEGELDGTVVAVGEEPPGEVVVDEAAAVDMLAAEPPEPLFPGGQRALEPDGDAGQAGRDRAQVDREKPGPAPYEPAAQGDEGQVGQVHGDDHVGQATSDHLLTVPCLPRLSIGRCAAGEASLR